MKIISEIASLLESSKPDWGKFASKLGKKLSKIMSYDIEQFVHDMSNDSSVSEFRDIMMDAKEGKAFSDSFASDKKYSGTIDKKSYEKYMKAIKGEQKVVDALVAIADEFDDNPFSNFDPKTLPW